jgi:hypothetical protein
VGVMDGEHAGGGGGGVGEGGIAFQYQHAGTAGMEFQGKREANDAGASNEDVRHAGNQIC